MDEGNQRHIKQESLGKREKVMQRKGNVESPVRQVKETEGALLRERPRPIQRAKVPMEKNSVLRYWTLGGVEMIFPAP